jgi:hypothetical protein
LTRPRSVLSLPLPEADPPAPAINRAPLAVEPLLSRADLADVLRTSLRSLDRLASAGKLPRPDMYLTARQPRWRAETVRNWINQQSNK